jgi:hypothetical protein
MSPPKQVSLLEAQALGAFECFRHSPCFRLRRFAGRGWGGDAVSLLVERT